MKVVNFITLFQYFDNNETLLSEQIENKTARILLSPEREISVEDLDELHTLKIRLLELVKIEADIMGLLIEL